jgi:hypothetical protein
VAQLFSLGHMSALIPRDPKRIDRMVELLREAWQLCPDERLTQLVINATDTHHDCGPVYYFEDDKMEQTLQHLIEGRRRYLRERGKI